MTPRLPRTHRGFLSLHRWLLRRFGDRFPGPWADDAHQTARTAVRTVFDRDGWLPALATAVAECTDVARIGFGTAVSRVTDPVGRIPGDVRHAVRRMVGRPGRSLAVALTLAVGVGASTAVFSVVNNTLLRPMMLRDVDSLVRIDDATPDGSQRWDVSPLNADVLLRAPMSTLSRVIIQEYQPFVLTGRGDPERLRGVGVSAGFTEGLGVSPVLGRTFTQEEQRLGAEAPSALVSYDLWQRHWGGDPGVVGSVAVLNGRPRTVIGVLPRGFHFPYEANVWVPLSYDATVARDHYLLVFGRTAGGASVSQVQEELDAVSARARRAAPDEDRDVTLTAMPLRENLVRGYDRTALSLLSVVGFLLLVGAVNVASLGLAEAHGRAREMAVRSALGATRGRQATQLLAESGVFAALGGAGGVGLSVLMRPFLSLLVPPVMSVELAQDDITLDHRVLLFALGAALVSALVSGVLPALRAPVRDLAGVLRDGGAPGRTTTSRSGLGVVALEVALAMVLLTGAGAVVAAYVHDQARAPGYHPAGVLTLRASLPEARYPDDGSRVRVVRSLMRHIGAVPGVAAAGVATDNPSLGGWVERVSGQDVAEPRDVVQSHIRFVTPGLFSGLGIPVTKGRTLDEQDDRGASTTVVSVSLAARLWGDARSALGRTLVLPDGVASDTHFTVVGVCGDVKEEDAVPAAVYLPYPQDRGHRPAREIDMFVRAARDLAPASLAPAVRAAVREVDPDLALFGVLPQTRVRSRASVLAEAGAFLAAGFIGFGLLLSAVGVFGVMTNISSRSIGALGIRKALGARPFALLRAALQPTLVAVGCGLAGGGGGALLIQKVLGTVIPGVDRPDTLLYGLVAGVLTLVALLSALGPVVKAVLVDPARVLRAD